MMKAVKNKHLGNTSNQTARCTSESERNSGVVDLEAAMEQVAEDNKAKEEEEQKHQRCQNPDDCVEDNFLICNCMFSRRWVLSLVVLLLGSASCAVFLSLSVQDELETSAFHFEQSATELANSIRSAWHEYEVFGLWAQESCTKLGKQNPQTIDDKIQVCTQADFLHMYETMLSMGLHLYSLQYVAKVEHQYRAEVEQELTETLREVGWNASGIMALDLSPQVEKEVYYPILRAEPLAPNAAVVGLDVTGTQDDMDMLHIALTTWKPVLSPPVVIHQEQEQYQGTYSVFLTHPGVNTSLVKEPRAVTATVVRIPDLLLWAAKQSNIRERTVYLFDAKPSNVTDEQQPLEWVFAGGAEIRHCDSCPNKVDFKSIPNANLTDVPQESAYFEKVLEIVDRQWLVVVVPLDDSHEADLFYLILAGVLIFLSFLLLSVVFWRYLERITVINAIKTKAEADKAAMAIEQVDRERRLNEYLAHEVRNPLASAMAALTFVSSTAMDVDDLEARKHILDDAATCDSSLNYINDLLRSMLDMNKLMAGKITLEREPTDVLRDVLQPATAILCMRGARVEVQALGPDDLVVMTDKLRLKQICVNLAINATKFVERGFIRLSSEIVDGHVRILIEDSGPGIPPEKKKALFTGHQESLDLLHQGTGIGLSICKYLSKLLNAKIWLDDDYHSGIDGCPGARFVVDLQQPPVDDFENFLSEEGDESNRSTTSCPTINASMDCSTNNNQHQVRLPVVAEDQVPQLPENIKVLFIDDEAILRKLFIRAVDRAAPTWTVQEAGNAHAAMQMIKENPNQFDAIFIDQYMPCIERPLLGTEAVQKLRSLGVRSKICGLSANDLRHDFESAGANGFLIKPFPCSKEKLSVELARLFHAPHVVRVGRQPSIASSASVPLPVVDESMHSEVEA